MEVIETIYLREKEIQADSTLQKCRAFSAFVNILL